MSNLSSRKRDIKSPGSKGVGSHIFGIKVYFPKLEVFNLPIVQGWQSRFNWE
jgi:hypothetical protein